MTATGLPFDDMRDLLRRLPAPDGQAAARVRAGFGADEATLGRLVDLAAWLASVSGRVPPRVTRPLVAVFAGTHGVSRRLGPDDGVTTTRARVERIASGGAPVSRLSQAGGFGLKVFDLALEHPAGDISVGPALDERDCAATMAFGMEAVAGGTDLLCLGDLGADNDIAAAAILAQLHGGAPAEWMEDGARAAVVETALACHRNHLGDPLEVLRRLGGREIAAIAGAIVAARMEKVPALLAGPATMAAAAVLHAAEPDALRHCIVADAGADVSARLARDLELDMVLDLGISAGEGTSAVLAAGLVKSAAEVAGGPEN